MDHHDEDTTLLSSTALDVFAELLPFRVLLIFIAALDECAEEFASFVEITTLCFDATLLLICFRVAATHVYHMQL